jgi:LacI family transcriptional regulator
MGIQLPRSGPATRRPVKVTLREVAQAAGVSPMTVSNFINRKFQLMRPETAKRIGREVEQLGYRPQFTGRGLRTAKRFSIGMLIVDERPTFLADPFITQIVGGLTNCLNLQGYGLLLQGVRAQEFRDATFFRDARTDGLCVFLSGSEARRGAMLDHIRALGEAVVAFEETDAQRSAGMHRASGQFRRWA